MGQNAAARYQQYFAADQMTSKYLDLYQTLCGAAA
jgi:hypothetical protein